MAQKQFTNESDLGKPNPPSPKSRLAMLKRTKKASSATSDPFRFQNNGVTYKGKLIGEQDVEKARGDAMCADAMRLAKSIVKAAGAHKIRINLQINLDGIKILDEKSGAVIHNFPVSRISFIARDTTDARAFGLVYGDAAGKYKFYGIKTAQTADQAVLAIRDMFQVVFEMKKKQIEQVKQQQAAANESPEKKEAGVAVADLLDLESELEQIEQGVQQLANVPTFVDAFGSSPFGDPFADSFAQSTTPVNGQSTTPSNDAWNAFPSAPAAPQQPSTFGAWNDTPQAFIPQQPTINHAHSMPAFAPQQPFAAQPAFSETNPFATAAYTSSAFGALPPRPAAAPAAFNSAPTNAFAQDPFATTTTATTAAAANAFGEIDWATNENTAPQQNPPLHHANTFSNFGDNKQKWEEKRVTSLEEAFTKLVDMDSLIDGKHSNETKKNPFDHIINPPKATLNTLSTGPQQFGIVNHQAPQAIPANSDPFRDSFFN